jgi:hypothetical protein
VQQVSVAVAVKGTGVQGLQVYATMLEALIEMQLVGPQFGPGRTVTMNVFVARLPHWSCATTCTGVVEFCGKQ